MPTYRIFLHHIHLWNASRDLQAHDGRDLEDGPTWKRNPDRAVEGPARALVLAATKLELDLK